MLVKLFSLTLFIFSFASSALAGMSISGTRIIFPGGEKEQSVRTNNKGKKPALVQVWIDNGTINADLNEENVPFIVTPPVFRVEPQKGQSVRLIYNGTPLPQDRESLFWFNLLEIPPVYKEMAKVDRLELAFRTRIKLFYRPGALTSTSTAQVDKIQWRLLPANKGISVNNPTAYYFSFDSATALNGSQTGELEATMVAPFSSAEFMLKKGVKMSAITGATFRLLNDYGSAYERTLVLTSGKRLVLQGN